MPFFLTVGILNAVGRCLLSMKRHHAHLSSNHVHSQIARVSIGWISVAVGSLYLNVLCEKRFEISSQIILLLLSGMISIGH